MAKIQPGLLSEYVCAECGERVSIDAQGKALCYFCGRLVAYVPAEAMRKPPQGKDIQLPLIKNGWGLWHE